VIKVIINTVVFVAATALLMFFGFSRPVSAHSFGIALQQQGGQQQGDQNNNSDRGKKDQKEDINDDRQDGPNDNLQEGPNDERNDDREMDKAEGQDGKQEVADSKHESPDSKHEALFGRKAEADHRNHESTAGETGAGSKNEKVHETDVDNDRNQDQQQDQQDREQDKQEGTASQPPSLG
jgi:hypothetical protein